MAQNERNIGIWELWGFAVVSLCGTLLHFWYDISGSLLVAAFSGVNESTWEHMKLLFWPMLLFALIQRHFFRELECFWSAKLRGTLIGLALIPIIFYTYNGVIGISPDWINIAIFFISAAVAYAHEARLLRYGSTRCIPSRIALVILLSIGVLFVIFTYITPHIGIFRDPISGGYGIADAG